MPPSGVDYASEFLNGYAPEYVVVDDRKPLEYKNFVEFIYEKPVGDKGYIGKSLFEKLMVNLLSALAAYCCFPKKPCIKVRRTYDIQPSLF